MELSIPEWSIRALLMVAGTGLLLSAFRVRRASVLHGAWTAAMVGMLLLPVWTKWGLSVNAPVLPDAPRWETIQTPERYAVPQPAAITPTEIAESFRSGIPSEKRLPSPDWRQVVTVVYLAGFALMLARLIRGTLWVRSMMRGSGQNEGFATSPLCAAPVTLGWLRPRLLLPDSWRTWPQAKLETVLIHEREHLRRRDPLIQWLALLNRCVFWFHPVAWWLERKLAALAEEACDAAVLAHGCAPHDYARFLIEMARTVNHTGARIRWAGAVTFSGGELPQRIRRIMDAPPVAPMPRPKSIALASLCALILAAFLACSPSRPTSSQPTASGPSPGQISMSEQDRRTRAAMQERQQKRRQSDALLRQGFLSLTPHGAKALQADIEAHPGDPDKMAELVAYYRSKNDLKALDALTLWFIGNHPEVRSGWGYRPEWDIAWDKHVYDRGRTLWTEQLKKSWDSPYVYMNAAEFLSGNDNEQAEQILFEGRRRFPASGQWSGLHWEVFLARHYAWALMGSPGQLPVRDALVPEEPGAPPAQGAYARKVREALLKSTDTELLTRTVEQLQSNRPNREFCNTLIERVLSLEPDNGFAHDMRMALRRSDIELRAQTDPGGLTDSDRIVLLQTQIGRRALAFSGAMPEAVVAKAHELLSLAAHNTKDTNYGTAIFLANMALGETAMQRGDRAQSVRYLLTASEAPPTEYLRYMQIDMSLPRMLVDAGERDAVATFLTRCAKFNRANEPLVQWAAQIRKGLNPRLMPNFNVFRQDG
jgi:hypothetical protein